MKKDGILVFLAFFSLFALLSYFHTPEFRGDAFPHFLDAVNAVSHFNIRDIVVNIWDKPIPTVLYGIPGLAGLFFARLASVVLVLLTACFTLDLARRFIRNMEGSPALTVVFFLMLVPVFLQTFVTMTELPAAFFLSYGLYLFYSRKAYLAAFLVTGFLPLARVECSLIMALLFVIFSLEVFLKNRSANSKNLFKEIKPIFAYLVIGSAPFILWNAAGAYFTQDIFWLWHDSYTNVRPFDLLYIIKHNALTASPMIFTAPALFLFLIGVSSPQKNDQDGSSPYFFFAIYGVLILHMIFLSATIPYPKTEVGWEKLNLVWNDRNFNVIAPVLALFVYMGASYIYELFYAEKNWSINGTEKKLAGAKILYLFFFSILLIYVCKEEFFISNSRKLYVTLLCLFSVVFFIPSLMRSRSLPKKTFLAMVSGFIICSFLITKPLFWNPTKYNDPDIVLQGELINWIDSNYRLTEVLVIQDLSNQMTYSIGKKNVHAPWAWPGQFSAEISAAPSKTLIVIQTLGVSRDPLPEYPPGLIETLKGYRMLKKSSAIWLGWMLYEKP
ncbi:MAG: hypothetical protein ABSH52_03210 [Terriglobia bacterium]